MKHENTTKTFTIDGTEYTVSPCTAIAITSGDTEPQDALLVEYTDDFGERFRHVVFGCPMPRDEDDFLAVCDDPNAWTSDCDILATVLR